MTNPVRPYWPNMTPQHVRIAIVGEAPGSDEVWHGLPFVGAPGRELTSLLTQVGINREECLLTNVLSEQPPNGNLSSFCLPREKLPDDYPIHIGPMVVGQGSFYLHPDRLWELERLQSELDVARPNVVIGLGATAAWALLGSTRIGMLRGTVHPSPRGYKVLPTWHPAAVLRQWQYRPVILADLAKAKSISAYPEIRYDNAEIWIEPTLADLHEFERRYMSAPGTTLVAPDVETAAGEITTYGFGVWPEGRDPAAIVVPFRIDPVTIRGKAGQSQRTVYTGNYWKTAAEEKAAWLWCQHIVERRAKTELVWQNGLYDIQYNLRHGLRPRNSRHDTMLAHHSKYAEMEKGLGFFGSVYTNHPLWKHLATRHQDALKRDA